VKKLEDQYWTTDGLVEERIERFVIELGADPDESATSTDDDETEECDMSGISPLPLSPDQQYT